VERGHLVSPGGLAGLRVASDDRHRPLLVDLLAIGSSALSRVPRRRVARAVVDEVQLGIPGVPAPDRAAAQLPLVAGPGLERAIGANGFAERHGLLGVEQDVAVRTHRVATPQALAGFGVVAGHEAADAELGTRHTDHDDVADDERSARAGFATLRI